jgi:biopolymer transport protein TolR
MGAQLAASGGRRKGGGRHKPRPVSDINVTPFVDVMLVLLIIFMVTAPLLTVSVPVDLPETTASSTKNDKEPIVVTINSKAELFLQETKVDEAGLVARLAAITKNDANARIFVRGDSTLEYGQIMKVMGMISAAGYTKVALVAELPKIAPPQRGKR